LGGLAINSGNDNILKNMKSTEQKTPAQVYVFSGEDDYLTGQDARNLVDKLVPPEARALGLEVIEAQARKSEEAAAAIVRCIEALRTPGFMGARKVIWLKGANFLDRGIIARSKEVSTLLGTLAEVISASLPEGNILVITSGTFDRASGLFKACSARGQVSRQEELKQYQKEKAAAGFIVEALGKRKLQVTREAIAAIVDLAGTESRQLAQEIGKLEIFVHPRQKIGEEDVFAIVSPARESEAIHLADAVGSRNLPQALQIMRQLLFQKENPIGLVMALETRFRYLLILRSASGESADIINALLTSDKGRPMHPYFLGKLKDQARLFSAGELAKCRDIILETRLKLVSTASDLEELLLEKLLVELCRRRKK